MPHDIGGRRFVTRMSGAGRFGTSAGRFETSLKSASRPNGGRLLEERFHLSPGESKSARQTAHFLLAEGQGLATGRFAAGAREKGLETGGFHLGAARSTTLQRCATSRTLLIARPAKSRREHFHQGILARA